MQLRQILISAALACVAGLSGAGEVADSTGPVRAKRALVVPESVTVETVKEIIITVGGDNAVLQPSIPQGYREITFQAGPHLGASPSYSEVSYGYSRVTFGTDGDGAWVTPAVDATLCGGDLTHRVIEVLAVPPQIYAAVPAATYAQYTCEPYGTVTRLVKNGTPSQTTTLSLTDVNAYSMSGTIGVNTSGAVPICQARGYTDIIPGTVTYWYKGRGCPGGYITQFRSGAWVTDSACYNNVLTGMQCYK